MSEANETVCPLCAGKMSADITELCSSTSARETKSEDDEHGVIEVTRMKCSEALLLQRRAAQTIVLSRPRHSFGYPGIL